MNKSSSSFYVGCVWSEVEFSTDNNHSDEPKPECSKAVSLEQSRPVEQTLILFLFLQHNDPFNSELSDLISKSHHYTIAQRHLAFYSISGCKTPLEIQN